ncbi:SDR family oxidoreductase [Pseudonocardia sp. ICBG162]|uniref:SDR family oxidoreductase n=1 Tax=Pseudonocardia sp. ICBG162 TaxID=2846761 RepID=UPI001CF6DC80|nr:SDR family oxidoreductase [Pseudonocardia sp. ICBG162]
MSTVVLVGAGDIAVSSAIELRGGGFDRAVVLTRGRSSSGESACAVLTEQGYRAEALRCDVSDWDSLAAVAARVDGPVRALVYSPAGDRDFRPLDELSQDAWDRALDVFAGGLVGAVKAFAPNLTRGASVVALSGTSAHSVVSSMHLAMGSAKAAVERAVTYLAAALGPAGVRVNAVASGPVETATIVRGLDDAGLDRLRSWQSAVTVPGRLARPADVGRIVAALCGPQLEWITGQVLLADGGASVMPPDQGPHSMSGLLSDHGRQA